nr:hypothetical protein [Tanacetum cinerariifolium]
MDESKSNIPMKQVQGGAETETSHKPRGYKKPSSGVVAQLMGLESLTNSSSKVETSKIMWPLNNNPSSIWPRNGKYLKALKQILETMQTIRRVLENKEQSLDGH